MGVCHPSCAAAVAPAVEAAAGVAQAAPAPGASTSKQRSVHTCTPACLACLGVGGSHQIVGHVECLDEVRGGGAGQERVAQPRQAVDRCRGWPSGARGWRRYAARSRLACRWCTQLSPKSWKCRLTRVSMMAPLRACRRASSPLSWGTAYVRCGTPTSTSGGSSAAAAAAAAAALVSPLSPRYGALLRSPRSAWRRAAACKPRVSSRAEKSASCRFAGARCPPAAARCPGEGGLAMLACSKGFRGAELSSSSER